MFQTRKTRIRIRSDSYARYCIGLHVIVSIGRTKNINNIRGEKERHTKHKWRKGREKFLITRRFNVRIAFVSQPQRVDSKEK